jgi:hypothetical protein
LTRPKAPNSYLRELGAFDDPGGNNNQSDALEWSPGPWPKAENIMQIVLNVPDDLGEKLQQLGDRLPELLDRALDEFTTEIDSPDRVSQDELQILDILASQPSPECVLAIRPTAKLQSRLSELLEGRKAAGLTQSEEAELDRYLLIEHWVRLAKAHAYKQLQAAS